MEISPENIKWKNRLAVVSGAMLLLAIPSIWPYGYFQFLRWVVAASAAFIAHSGYRIGRRGWMWTMIAIAILFNPLVPFYLSKGVWVLIDLVAAVIFFASISKLKLAKRT